jgi:very-short-patch-repair endonuclease
MKRYDAKNEQVCLLCGEGFSHNKQGRFTSHLIHVHQLNLHEYLLYHYYKPEDLICHNPICNNTVKLRRGVPNLFCSTSCHKKKDRKRFCAVCECEFTKQDLRVKTCSESCERKLRSFSIEKWHREMPEEQKRRHFSVIGQKGAKTRKNRYRPPWNKGKTGIYSEETIEKIRQATIQQLQTQSFRKTKIEKIVEGVLKRLNVNYSYSFVLEKRQYDFCLPDHKLLIECDGDYWHCNPKFYPKPTGWQLERKKVDELKNDIAERNGYCILRFWEDTILHNLNKVEKEIASYLSR